METKIESKTGKIEASSEKVYSFLSDFKNFNHLIPADKIKNWEADKDSCHFKVEGFGEAGLRIIEKQPFSLIKITGEEGSKFDFLFWIQLKEVSENDTRIKLTVKVELNPVLKMMATKPLQNFVNSLVDQIEKIKFNSTI